MENSSFFWTGWGVYIGVINIVIILFVLFIASISGFFGEQERLCKIKNEKAVSVTISHYSTTYYKQKTIFIQNNSPFLVG